MRAGRYDLALGYFQRVLDGLDKNAKMRGDVYMRIGETYRRKGDLAELHQRASGRAQVPAG